jgi:hypothetical protein
METVAENLSLEIGVTVKDRLAVVEHDEPA